MRDHRKLRAFTLADELVLKVYNVTSSFPTSEQFGLTSQVRRAAVSIASNIVEGCARETHADYKRFITIAYSSACEVNYQINLAQKLNFIKDNQFQALCSTSNETCKVLNGLLRSLNTKAYSLKPIA